MYEDIPLIINEADHEFEMIVDDDARAFIDYLQRGDTFLLIHTEVPEAFQGHGLAAALVEKTFRHLEANGFKMRPYCEYVQAYLQRHPEWNRLLA